MVNKPTNFAVNRRLGVYGRILLTIALLAGINPNLYAGGIYKWVDKEGNVHYSQDPVDQSSQPMNIKIPKTTASEEATAEDTNSAAKPQTTDDDKAGDKTKEQQAMQDAAARKQQEAQEKNCQIAMKRLATISAGGRLYEVDKKGERVYWDDATRQAKQADAQADVSKWCGQE